MRSRCLIYAHQHDTPSGSRILKCQLSKCTSDALVEDAHERYAQADSVVEELENAGVDENDSRMIVALEARQRAKREVKAAKKIAFAASPAKRARRHVADEVHHRQQREPSVDTTRFAAAATAAAAASAASAADAAAAAVAATPQQDAADVNDYDVSSTVLRNDDDTLLTLHDVSPPRQHSLDSHDASDINKRASLPSPYGTTESVLAQPRRRRPSTPPPHDDAADAAAVADDADAASVMSRPPSQTLTAAATQSSIDTARVLVNNQSCK